MNLFRYDNPVIRFIVRVGYIWYLNVLWLVTSLPIITIGASTTALVYSSMKLLHDEGYPTKNFFHSFKENFKQATLIWLIYAAVGAVLAIDLMYWNRQGYGRSNINVPWAISIAFCILYGISFCYVFAIQSKFYNSVKRTLAFALLLPFRHMKETVLIALTIGFVVYINLTTVFAVNFITLNIGVGLVAYLLAVFFTNIFENYVPKETQTEDRFEEGE